MPKVCSPRPRDTRLRRATSTYCNCCGGVGLDTGEELTIDYGETFWETVRLHEAIQTFTKVARGHAKFDVFVDVLSRL